MRIITSLLLLFVLNLNGFVSIKAQTPFTTSNYDITLQGSLTSTGSNRSGVAYNPALDIYYGNIAGAASYQFETYSGTGVLLFTATANIDVRGVWWNPTLNQLEMNTYNSAGIYQKTLDGNGYATATNNVIQAANVQPNLQSFGQYDWINNHFIYYNAGNIVRVNRATNVTVSTNAVTGLPVGTNLTDFAIGFTGVSNYEIVLYDYSNRRAIFVNGNTYAYTGNTQFPGTAIGTSWFNVGYANKRLFLCNTSERRWYGYPLFPDSCDGKPDVGKIEADMYVVECGQSTMLHLVDASNSNGITYQWQYNNGNGWTNFGSGNTSESSGIITLSTKFRCIVTCIPSAESDTTSEIAINFNTGSLNLGPDRILCVDEGHLEFVNAANYGADYKWDNNYNGMVRVVDKSGTYWVEVTLPNGCVLYDTINITFKPNPKVDLGEDTVVCNGVTLKLDAGNEGIQYYWSTGQTTPTVNVNNPGTYSVQVTGENGCVKVDSIMVNMQGQLPTSGGIMVNNLDPYTFSFTCVNPLNIIGYQWSFGDGNYSFTTNPIHTYANIGNYVVTLNLASVCGFGADTVTAHIYTKIDDVDFGENNILLYPNPAKGQVTIKASENVLIENVNIYNTLGQLVYTKAIKNINECVIALDGISTGMYQIEVTTNLGKRTTQLNITR